MTGTYDVEFSEDFDKYTSFLGNIVFLTLGFVFRRVGFVNERHMPGMTTLVFAVCLPLLMVGVLWPANLDSSVLKVLGLSALSAFLTIGSSILLTRWCKPSHRGFYLMGLTGNALSYVYPVLIRSPRFGADTAAVAVMWELGGNLLTAIVFQGIAGEAFAPHKFAPTPKLDVSAQEGDAKPAANLPPIGDLETAGIAVNDAVEDALAANPGCDDRDTNSTKAPSESSRSKLSHRSSRALAAVLAELRRYSIMVVRMPIAWGVLLGLLLNACGVPYAPLPGEALDSIVNAMPALLYFLLGANLRFDLDRSSIGLIVGTLTLRWLLNAATILFFQYVLPLVIHLEQVTIGVICLCLASPITSLFVLYGAEHGYRMDHIALTKNLSDLTSLLALQALAMVV